MMNPPSLDASTGIEELKAISRPDIEDAEILPDAP
jgi:hypothetical protein